MADPVIIVREPGRVPLHLIVREPLEFGRDCAGVLLDDPQVSRRHLEIRPTSNGVVVADLGSTNGTLIDGEPLTQPSPLTPGALLQLGDTIVQLAAGGFDGPGPVAGSPDDVEPRTAIERVADEVTQNPVVVEPSMLDGGTVTIVFSDIEDSTKRAIELGDTRWYSVLGTHNEIVRRRLAEFGGREIKNQGDGFMLTFPSARGALRSMIAVQRDLDQLADTGSPDAVRIRIGMHTGEAIVDSEGDLFGRHVIIAARIANLAEGGQILVSSIVREIVEARGDFGFADPVPVDLKGIDGQHHVHPVVWD